MKYARLGLAALAAVLVGLVLVATQPASGQVQGGITQAAPPPAVVTSVAPVQHQPGAGWFYNYSPPMQDSELSKLLAEESGIEHEAAGLIQEYSRTEDEAQRGKTKAKLAATLEKQFDLQQKRRNLEVARIEDQLKKLRDIMRKRGEGRQTIIDKRLDQLLREADGLGWTPPQGTPGPRNALYAPATIQAGQVRQR